MRLSHSVWPFASSVVAAIPYYLVLAVLSLAAYSNALDGGFFFDDHRVLDALQRMSDPWQAFLTRPFEPGRMVANASLLLDLQRGGSNPSAFLPTNVGIHTLNTCLLMLFLSRLIPSLERQNPRRFANAGSAMPAAFAASALFSVHPLLASCVNYTAQRPTQLATMFSLLAAASWLKARERRGLLLLLSSLLPLVSFYLAVRSKPIALPLPLWLLFLESQLTSRSSIKRGTSKPRNSNFALPSTLTTMALFMTFAGQVGEMSGKESLLQFWIHLQAHARALGSYASLLIWPDPSRMTIDHDFHLAETLVDPLGSGWIAIHLILVGVLFVLRNRLPPLVPLGIAWFYLMLAPYAFIMRPDILVEYKAYFPAIGAVMVLAALLQLGFRYPLTRSITLVSAGILLVVGLLVTRGRNPIYRREVDLWAEAAHRSPKKARIFSNLGILMVQEGRLAPARENFQKALDLEAGFIPARVNLAITEEKLGLLDDATRSYQEALARWPHPGPHQLQPELRWQIEAGLWRLCEKTSGIFPSHAPKSKHFPATANPVGDVTLVMTAAARTAPLD